MIYFNVYYWTPNIGNFSFVYLKKSDLFTPISQSFAIFLRRNVGLAHWFAQFSPQNDLAAEGRVGKLKFECLRS